MYLYSQIVRGGGGWGSKN